VIAVGVKPGTYVTSTPVPLNAITFVALIVKPPLLDRTAAMPASPLSEEIAVTLWRVSVWATAVPLRAVMPPTVFAEAGPSCQHTLSRITIVPPSSVPQPPVEVEPVPWAVTRSRVPPPVSWIAARLEPLKSTTTSRRTEPALSLTPGSDPPPLAWITARAPIAP
jgi:hypothetical protein